MYNSKIAKLRVGIGGHPGLPTSIDAQRFFEHLRVNQLVSPVYSIYNRHYVPQFDLVDSSRVFTHTSKCARCV